MTTRQLDLKARLNDLVRLMRVEDYGTFIQLVAGYGLGGGHDLGYLAVGLLILAPGLYGGLYALNDAHDYRADRRHPKKATRPVAAGRVSPRTAYMIGVGLVALSLAAALAFDRRVFVLAVLFVAFNLAYTFWLKTVPYVEIAMNTVTHALRVAGGLWLAGSGGYGSVIAAGFLAVLAISTLKRFKELREAPIAVRPVLRYYTLERLTRLMTLSLAGVAVILLVITGWEQVLTGVWLMVGAGTVVGYLRVPPLRRLADRVWR